jgi:hypothetical protein
LPFIGSFVVVDIVVLLGVLLTARRTPVVFKAVNTESPLFALGTRFEAQVAEPFPLALLAGHQARTAESSGTASLARRQARITGALAAAAALDQAGCASRLVAGRAVAAALVAVVVAAGPAAHGRFRRHAGTALGTSDAVPFVQSDKRARGVVGPEYRMDELEEVHEPPLLYGEPDRSGGVALTETASRNVGVGHLTVTPSGVGIDGYNVEVVAIGGRVGNPV